MDHIPPGSSVLGILKAKLFEWVVIPIPGALADPGIKPVFAASASGFFASVPPGKATLHHNGL